MLYYCARLLFFRIGSIKMFELRSHAYCSYGQFFFFNIKKCNRKTKNAHKHISTEINIMYSKVTAKASAQYVDELSLCDWKGKGRRKNIDTY